MKIRDTSVDIIIPIYNALEDLKRCISSVKKNTNLNKYRLVLIDDKSPDVHVKEYLDSVREEGILIMSNNVNLGFSATVNRGLALSEKNDVVLLNSDTMVTPGWIEKLIECAYSDEGIATVTPLSNNASICSVPMSNTSNEMPDNMTLDEYAAEIERISLREYPSIPMAVGFCMYIKRSVINEVGLFDSSAFGRGYGEENDYCNRATELGYRHVICDNIFIYHKGTASFDDKSKTALGMAHEEVLEERYPQLNRKLEWYWCYEQNGSVQKNVELYSSLQLGSDKKNILYLLQADFQEGCSNNIGGTQLHVKDLVECLRDEYNFFVVARDEGLLRVTAYVENRKVALVFPIGALPLFSTYRNQKIRELYEDLLKAFKIDLVHIHHTMGMTLELYYAAQKLGIPVYASLHDYYYICPTLRLLDVDKKSCIGTTDWEKCQRCMKNSFGVYEGVGYIPKWRMENEKVLKICEKIIVPSKSASDIILQYYPDIADKMRIIYHGIDKEMFFKENYHLPYHHKKLRVAFVGGICETKGSEVIYRMISACKDEFKWYIFGGVDGQDMINLKQSNLVKTGWYKREELRQLLRKHEIDIVCILSKVAETYCYTLSEVAACGVPVIATDIGALGERMRKMKSGWLVPANADHEVLLDLLRKISNTPEEYAEKCEKAGTLEVRSSREMAEDYRVLYAGIKKSDAYKGEFRARRILEGYLLAEKKTNVKVPVSSIDEIVARNRQLEDELKMVYDSEIFKVMKKIAGVIDCVKKLKR